MAVMEFLAALPSEYDSAKAQILSCPKISSLQETFSKILHTEVSSSSISSPTLVSTQMSSALIGRTIESERQQNRNSNTRGPGSGGAFYYYCHKHGHVIQDFKKRQNRNKKFQYAHIAFTTKASNHPVQFSTSEVPRFQLYQDSLRSPSTPITAIVESGNLNKCLISFSSS